MRRSRSRRDDVGPHLHLELPIETILAVQRVAEQLERAYRDAHHMTGGEWPSGCCVEASYTLLEDLQREVPDAGAEYIWGDFVIGPLRRGHAWVELRDRTIVDLTAGQFTMGAGLAIIPPGHELADHYEVRARGLPGNGAP